MTLAATSHISTDEEWMRLSIEDEYMANSPSVQSYWRVQTPAIPFESSPAYEISVSDASTTGIIEWSDIIDSNRNIEGEYDSIALNKVETASVRYVAIGRIAPAPIDITEEELEELMAIDDE